MDVHIVRLYDASAIRPKPCRGLGGVVLAYGLCLYPMGLLPILFVLFCCGQGAIFT